MTPALPKRRLIPYLLASAAVLVPCFWQARIQAGDLSSHIYNSWLAQLIESGRLPGLIIAPQTTNMLFDLMLSGWFRLCGPDWGQRAAVSMCVLVFVWGAFAFLSSAAGRQPWHLLPCAAMLAYGWVFHMGFFNFYLALGLSFWALAVAWDLRPRRIALAVSILLLAYTAHALPVLWAAGLLGYSWIAKRVSAASRVHLLCAALLLIAVLRAAISRTLASSWSLLQISLATGADQVSVFDGKYAVILAGLLVLWGSLLVPILRRDPVRELVASVPFQFSILSAAAVFLLPSAILPPGYRHALVYIAERMSLAAGICICGLLGTAQPRATQKIGALALAAVFFLFLFWDERALNRFEDRVDDAVAQLAPGQRVVSPIVDPDLRVNALAHVIDRACLGRCFSYANYEPSTAQFRVRAVAGNPYVVGNYGDSWDLQNGKYVVKPEEQPLVKVTVRASGAIAIESLKAGALCGGTLWEVLRNQMPGS